MSKHHKSNGEFAKVESEVSKTTFTSDSLAVTCCCCFCLIQTFFQESKRKKNRILVSKLNPIIVWQQHLKNDRFLPFPSDISGNSSLLVGANFHLALFPDSYSVHHHLSLTLFLSTLSPGCHFRSINSSLWDTHTHRQLRAIINLAWKLRRQRDRTKYSQIISSA